MHLGNEKMSSQTPGNLRLVLCSNEGSRVTVDMEAFFDLSFWMAEQLQDLEYRCRRYARPAGSHPRRRGLRDLPPPAF